MHNFLHKCLILVEATGLEAVHKTLNPFIYKGLRVFTPNHSPKSFILSRMSSMPLFNQKRSHALLFFLNYLSLCIPLYTLSERVKLLIAHS
jgi:hypothetical protein